MQARNKDVEKVLREAKPARIFEWRQVSKNSKFSPSDATQSLPLNLADKAMGWLVELTEEPDAVVRQAPFIERRAGVTLVVYSIVF